MFLHTPPFAMFLRFTCSNNVEGGACMNRVIVRSQKLLRRGKDKFLEIIKTCLFYT